jgi:hypothetical protein
LDAAVARGEWQPPSVDEANFREMFERMPNLPTSFRLDIGIPA